jgi:hypothetical protein
MGEGKAAVRERGVDAGPARDAPRWEACRDPEARCGEWVGGGRWTSRRGPNRCVGRRPALARSEASRGEGGSVGEWVGRRGKMGG